MFLCPSFCVFASEYYDKELYKYNDSFVSDEENLDSSLYFVPLLPESDLENYFLFYDNTGTVYAYISDSFVKWFDIYRGCMIPNDKPFEIYQFKSGISNDWIYYGGSKEHPWTYYSFPGLRPLDSSMPVNEHFGDDYYKFTSVQQKDGYRIYWLMSLILKQLLQQVDFVSNYVLKNEVLRYSLLSLFCGELLLFVFYIIRIIGDIRHEKT